LRVAMIEIEKITKTSRDLAKTNQELEESRLQAMNDQARTAKRLLLVSSQLEHTEQQLFNLTKEISEGQKDSDLLRIERIKREALQEREDAGRVKIDALQDELHEVQRSERLSQQKLLIMQTKYEALGKRHDLLRRQQQELDLVRESKEALAWLKETTDRLCSPPQGSLGQAIQQEKALQGSTVINIHQQPSLSSSPPYPSAIGDPPLVAQNQLVSLIKELATANSTLRTEVGEYRELLQDSRNEVIHLRSQVEDYEQGHAFECCDHCSLEDSSELHNGALDTLSGQEQQKEHHGMASPPPYMSTPIGPLTEQHVHHHIHLPGVRGNILGELERSYHQEHQLLSSHRRRNRHTSKKDLSARRSSRDHAGSSHSKHARTHHVTVDGRSTATVSTSTSTSEARRGSTSSGQNPLAKASVDSKKVRHHEHTALPRGRGKRSFYTDADMDLLDSQSDDDIEGRKRGDDDHTDLAELLSEIGDSGSDQEQSFVAKFAE
ncbi:hypothetical protein BGZ65_009225, partial [Modicella reniformis]